MLAKQCPHCGAALSTAQLLGMNTGRRDQCTACGRPFGWRARPGLLIAALVTAGVSVPVAGWLVLNLGAFVFAAFVLVMIADIALLAVLAMTPTAEV
jgi:uncharacterized protein (DUF983 family)